MYSISNESTERLFDVISRLDTKEKCRAFFEDLCTIKEIQDMAQRFDTAVLLGEGMSYSRISKEVGVSSATICRVNRCMSYGADGYKIAISAMKESKKK